MIRYCVFDFLLNNFCAVVCFSVVPFKDDNDGLRIDLRLLGCYTKLDCWNGWMVGWWYYAGTSINLLRLMNGKSDRRLPILFYKQMLLSALFSIENY